MEITTTDWLKLILSFKYISNSSIIIAILAYCMNAYDVFFICIPLIITNFVLFVLLSVYDFDNYIHGVLATLNPNIDLETINKYKNEFVLFNIVWHTVPLFWIYSVLDRDNIIQIFKPNFINIFFKSLMVIIVYFYLERDIEPYGKINYLWYFIVYIIVLFGANVILYLDK